jgi:hypothetical protein
MELELIEGWTSAEQAIAQQAFGLAYGRAVKQLIATIQQRGASLNTAEEIWELHDFLSIERHTIEGRFAFKLDGILFVFASLVKEQLLEIEELSGLEAEKLAKVSAMARF